MIEKHGPPLDLAQTTVNGENSTVYLDTTYVGKQPKPGTNPAGGGFRVPPTRPGGMGSGITHTEGLRRETRDKIKATQAWVKNEYSAKSQGLPRLTEVELATARELHPAHVATPAQSYQHEVNIRNILIQQKTTALYAYTVQANDFYGHSPFNATIGDYLIRAQALDRSVTPYGPAYSKWANSYQSAHTAKLLTEQIQLLNNQQAHVQNLLAAAQVQEQIAAAEQARVAALAEAMRVAAEQARIAALAEAERIAAEQARIAALAEGERIAAEQARVAAHAAAEQAAADLARITSEEAQRVLAELARLKEEETQRAVVDANRRNMEERQRAQEEFKKSQIKSAEELRRLQLKIAAEDQARIAKLNAAIAEVEANSLEAADQFAAEQSRLESEMERQIEAMHQKLQREGEILELRRKIVDTATAVAKRQAQLATRLIKLKNAERGEASAPTFINVGHLAASGFAFSGTTGAGNIGPGAALALRVSLRAAISAITGAIAPLSAPLLVGFAALLAPSRLGNGDLYSVSVPLSELLIVSDDALFEVATTGGEIDLPLRLGAKTSGNRVEIIVASTSERAVPANVQVRLAHFDSTKNVYISASTVPNGPVVTWTPVAHKQNPSTSFPLAEPDLPIYQGATVTPIEGRTDPFPSLDSYEFGGYITIFPAASGIPPLLIVFNSPYDGATVTGEYSGRNFNPELAGGPILKLEWHQTVIEQAGIEAVKLHISRLDQSDANNVMVQRLESILNGHLVVTDTDLRYYTHEIRELERFRVLGLSDDFKPEMDSPIWNNAHTATLEDFKLQDVESLLYTEEAISAADRQDERFFNELLKGANL